MSSNSMSPDSKIEWTFAATNAASCDACARAENWAREAGFPEILVMRLVLVIEELFTNTIKHGYHAESNCPVQISLRVCDGRAVLDYRDQAPPFDPVHTKKMRASGRAPTRVGGMGLRLIQTYGTDASHVHQDGWNIVRLAVGADISPV
ncbi:MAG: ATP-binding protein [Pseudomonadota bacterium]